MKKWPAYHTYLILTGATSFSYALVFTINMIYQVETVGLNPLQLVLVGTTLELSAMLFEIPTGIVADVYSRRLSIIIGLVLIGTGFAIEGLLPIFEGVLLAQVVWGIGYTFTSGATDAWITDEIGIDRASGAFLRASQVGAVMGLAGIVVSVVLASIALNVSIIAGGVFFILLGGLLVLVMPETGFAPTPSEERQTWRTLFQTFIDGVQQIRGRRMLLIIVGLSICGGLFSEGFDRLWTAHILDAFTLPSIAGLGSVAWFGVIGAVSSVLGLVMTEIARRLTRLNEMRSVIRSLMILYIMVIVGLAGFAQAPVLPVALAFFWTAQMARGVTYPLEMVWINRYTDSRVRATVISVYSQANAFGQIAGGPAVGLVGTLTSVRVAITTSAMLLLPGVGLLWFARDQDIRTEAEKLIITES